MGVRLLFLSFGQNNKKIINNKLAFYGVTASKMLVNINRIGAGIRAWTITCASGHIYLQMCIKQLTNSVH